MPNGEFYYLVVIILADAKGGPREKFFAKLSQEESGKLRKQPRRKRVDIQK
jgi:hypothetical protein